MKPLDYYEYFQLELLASAIRDLDLTKGDNPHMIPQRKEWVKMWEDDINKAMTNVRIGELLALSGMATKIPDDEIDI